MAALALQRLLLATAIYGIATAGAQGFPSLEYEVKAAFLYNFARFIDWPEEAFPSADTPLVIGILGRDPFGPALDLAVADRSAADRRLVVRRIASAEDADECHVLFIAGSEATRWGRILAEAARAPVLTVGESGGFVEAGGMIEFIEEDGRIQFEINLDAARRSGLEMRSKLLKVARRVHEAGDA